MKPSLAALLEHLRGRAALALALALVALIARFFAPAPPARTVDAIARMLGDAVGGAVGPDDFIWEERGGFLHDALIGRRVLFLASNARGDGAAAGSADLYRARVRLTRSGRPVSLREVHNLTETPIGDDRELCARGRRVAFKTAALGGVQGVSLLDLSGDGPDREARTLSERARAAVEGWIETGSLLGVARTEVAFHSPPGEVRLDLADGALVMALGPEGLPAALDLTTGELNTGGKDPFGARVQRIPHPVRSFAEVAELSARRLIGPGAARTVERAVLAAGRFFQPRIAPRPAHAPPAGVPSPTGWPPPAIPPAIRPPLPGEGAWAVANGPFLAPAAGGSGEDLAHFYETFIRPDPARPEVWVHLIALDTRRIELEISAGYDAPRPAVGPRGAGKLSELTASAPRGAADRLGSASAGAADRLASAGAPTPVDRVIGAFGVGISDRRYGVVAGGRVLVPPMPGAATLAVERDGHPALGPWPFGPDVPPSVRALLQGPPLFDSGAAPDGDGDLLVERAALCVTGRGFVIHAWGRDLDAVALRRALLAAGCESGLLLGRSPAPLGFAYLDRRDDGGYRAERLSPAMSLSPQRLAAGSPSAFAYLVLRDPAPSLPLPEDASWAPDGGTQPQPAWLPAIYGVDVVHLGARVHVLAFAPDRLLFRVRAGSREVSPRDATPLPQALSPEEQPRVLAAIGLGIGRRRGARGLAVGGTIGLRLRGEGGLLVARDQRVEILPAGAPIAPGADATELPLTADDSKLRPEAREIAAMRYRSAACALADGTFLVAATTFDSDEATTQALLDLGCGRVVALDRGTRRPAFVHRAGAAPPPPPEEGEAPAAPTTPQASYEDTTLYLIDTPMPGRGRALTPR